MTATPYGNWTSPVKASTVAAQTLGAGIEDVLLDPVTSRVYYAQKRPAEGGRSAIVDASDYKDMFDHAWDARTRVNEYGGGVATIYDSVLYFSHFGDNRVYMTKKGETPKAITPESPVHRYADFAVHPIHSHLVICNCEDHTGNPPPPDVQNYLVIIDSRSSKVTQITSGADFYICARFSPNGNFLTWQQWYLPDMPHQSSLVMVASSHVSEDASKITLGQNIRIAGEADKVGAQDPIWTSDSSIVFFCDISGFQNPWKFTFRNGNLSEGIAEPVLPTPVEEEYGAVQYFLSRHASGALSESSVVSASLLQGRSRLYLLDLIKGTRVEIETPFVNIQYIHGNLSDGKVTFLGQPADAADVITEFSIIDGNPVMKSISPSPPEDGIPKSYISVSRPMTLRFKSDGRICHVNYFPPTNPDYNGGVPGERPPVLVWLHGGPYLMENCNLDWSKQFWTTRGWARIEVNYGGSTGYGREYRESLNGNWGILDIQDAWESVIELGEQGLVDPDRAVIAGQSAGGYSVLQAATTLADLYPSTPSHFSAGFVNFGASEMRDLALVLPKFEWGLLDRAFGKWEDNKGVWRERSPIYHGDKIKMPMLFLQGDRDPIVPVPQMSQMVDLIKSKGVKAELIVFEGEGHGWRKASTIQAVLEHEVIFANEVLGIEGKA